MKLFGKIYLRTSKAKGIQASEQESPGEGNRRWLLGSVFFLMALSVKTISLRKCEAVRIWPHLKALYFAILEGM